MKRFVEGTDRGQGTLLPECLDDWVDENNAVRVNDAFVDALHLAELGFEGVEPADTGRPAYHLSALLKLYVYGYLTRVQSSRRLEREAGRNVELMWLLGRLVRDHKTGRRLPEGTTAVPSARCVRALSNSAGRWVCLRRRALRSTAASSRR
jgi:transposase